MSASDIFTSTHIAKTALTQALAYIVTTVAAVHPALVKAGSQGALTARADTLLRALPDEIPRWRVGVTVAELLRVLDDGHTSTDLSFGSSYLPLQFAWLSDGLIVAPVTGSELDIPVASEVLRIGGLDTAALAHKLAELIPENPYAVRDGVHILPAESVLRWLGVVRDDVQGGAVTLELRTPSSEFKAVRVGLTGDVLGFSQDLKNQLRQARGLAAVWHTETDLLAWRVGPTYGFFWLKTCDDTPEYREAVGDFFRAVVEARVKHVVVSVQGNGGGNSEVVNALLAHLPVGRYVSFALSVRMSKTALELLGAEPELLAATPEELEQLALSRGEPLLRREGEMFYGGSEEISIEQTENVFDGDVYVLTDSGSYSAAVDLGTVLRDNNLATLVGEPTGGMPTSYGDLLGFTTPQLSVPFWVSYKHFVRPDPRCDPADTLAPDVPLPVTVNAVQTGHSPILEWLERFASE